MSTSPNLFTDDGSAYLLALQHQELLDHSKPDCKDNSLKSVLRTVLDCLEAHRKLFVETHVLHREADGTSIAPDGCLRPKATREYLGQSNSGKSDNILGTRDRVFRSFRLLAGSIFIIPCYKDDVESFFWVLFWFAICHKDREGYSPTDKYEKWKSISDSYLGGWKARIVSDKWGFADVMEADFTPFYKPLATTMEKLRKTLFPEDQSDKPTGLALFDKVESILEEGIFELEF